MKQLMGVVVGALCLLSAGPSWAGLGGFLSAKVSGTIQQSITVPGGQKVVTTKLTNQVIFDDGHVSPDQYELVLSNGAAGTLELLPRNSMAKLPTIVVFTLTDGVFLLDTKSQQDRFGGGLFQGLTGGMTGVIQFHSPGPARSESLTAEGSSGSSGSIFKIKARTHGLFVQSP
jgi:hypothetical protein